MSFALNVKEEVISHDFNEEQQKAFLSGFIKQNGELVFSNNNQKLKITTISNRIARSLIAFIKKIFSGSVEIAIIQSQTLKKNKVFQITLIGQVQKFLLELFIVDQQMNRILKLPKKWLDEDENFRAFISGLFIATGSVNSPKTSNYHLELQFKHLKEAEYIKSCLEKYRFDFKILKRKYRVLLYLKKSLLVSDFLKFIDAPQSVMEFENERISRDMINNINRISNIDISNQSKVLKTATSQIEKIKYLQRKNRLQDLSPKAVLLAKIRVKKPELSYLELEEEMAKHGEKITKSGISYLFRSIDRLYEKVIKENKGDKNEK